MRMKAWMVTVSSVVMFVGCVTEQERIARITAEKARQEQIAQEAKEREEREAKERKEREEREAKERKEREEREAKERKEREEREARERIETYHQRIEAYWSDLANNNAKLILSSLNPLDKRELRRSDLKNWLKPRNGISPESAAEGEALLEEFGTKYMPNAYANYEKARLAAQEFQSLFNDTYPTGTPSSPAVANAFAKTIKGFSTARTRYFRYRDELCHYYVMNKVGAMNMEELSHIDNGKIWIRLLEEVPNKTYYTDRREGITMDLTHGRESLQQKMDDRLNAFAAKYAPEMSELHRKCIEELALMEKICSELTKDILILDVVRYEMGEIALYLGIARARSLCNYIVTKLADWQVQHMSMDMTAEQISKLSQETTVKLQNEGANIGNWVAQRANGPMILNGGAVLGWHWRALGIDKISTDIDVPSFNYLFSQMNYLKNWKSWKSAEEDVIFGPQGGIKEKRYKDARFEDEMRVWKCLDGEFDYEKDENGTKYYTKVPYEAYLISYLDFKPCIYVSRNEGVPDDPGVYLDYKTDDCPFIIRLNETDFEKGIHQLIVRKPGEREHDTRKYWTNWLLLEARVQFADNKQKATNKEKQND